MARYIDADKLIAHLKDEIEGCKQSFNSRANGKGIAYGTELGLKSAISFVETLATADVVPKSEVDKLHEVIFMKEDLMQSIAKERNYYYDELQKAKQEVEEIVRQWKEEANCWQNNYITEIRANEQIKQEVAREIFEEIERSIFGIVTPYQT